MTTTTPTPTPTPAPVAAPEPAAAAAGCPCCHSLARQHTQLSGVRLLVWDAPNIDMAITGLLGHKPTPDQRPNMDVLIDWLAARAHPDEHIEACVFVNVASSTNGLQNWVTYLLATGLRVFAKPKHDDHDDIDPDMLTHIDLHTSDGAGLELRELIVASHDAANFADRLDQLATDLPVSVLAFPERAGRLAATPRVGLIDPDTIPGLITAPLPRTSIHQLPAHGRWLDPTTPTLGHAPAADDTDPPPAVSLMP